MFPIINLVSFMAPQGRGCSYWLKHFKSLCKKCRNLVHPACIFHSIYFLLLNKIHKVMFKGLLERVGLLEKMCQAAAVALSGVTYNLYIPSSCMQQPGLEIFRSTLRKERLARCIMKKIISEQSLEHKRCEASHCTLNLYI